MATKKTATKTATEAESTKKPAEPTAQKKATAPVVDQPAKKSVPKAQIGDIVKLHGIGPNPIAAQLIDKTEDHRATLVYHDETGAPQHLEYVDHESNATGDTFWK